VPSWSIGRSEDQLAQQLSSSTHPDIPFKADGLTIDRIKSKVFLNGFSGEDSG